jgi:hypothetical protein
MVIGQIDFKRFGLQFQKRQPPESNVETNKCREIQPAGIQRVISFPSVVKDIRAREDFQGRYS